jgi:hypothetical protein
MQVDSTENGKVDLPWCLCGWEKFSSILRRQAFGLRPEFRLRGLVERRRRSGPRGDGRAEFHEKLFLAGGRADAKQSRRLWGRVSKLMGRIGRDVDGGGGSDDLLDSAKGGLYFSLKNGERFLEVVTMRGRTSAWGDVHIDEAEAPRGIFAADQDRVCIPNDPDVRMLVIIGAGERE